MSIVVNNLTYHHSDGEKLFTNVSFSIQKGQKAALIGLNGSGKSTLLKIIAGEIKPSNGEVFLSNHVFFMPQQLNNYSEETIAEVLGIHKKIKALHAILSGDVSEQHFQNLNEDWEIEERVKEAFSRWGLDDIQLFRSINTLSGGEKTKVVLTKISLENPEVILLDEPSNHLDLEGREILYQFIRNSKSTILVASHDRAMLNQLDITLELSDKGIEVYGGNYDFYKEQNQLKIDALQAQLAEQEKSIKQSLKQVQQLTELRQRRETRGRRHTEKAGLPRIIAGALASKAQQTTSRMKTQQESKIDELNRKLSNTQQQIKKIIPLRMKLKAPPIHRGKILVEATDINVSYRGKGLWAEPLNLKIISGDRIHLIGANGTGKTSLIKLIRSELEISKGRLDIAPFSSFYIDQEYSLLNHSNILIEQLQEFNDRALLDHELKTLLHWHQFPVEAWNKQCRMLSGGEKMKLLLCCMGLRNSSPDVLLLDEPTNNIDVYSQEILTRAIRDYHGTLVVVSHDSYFIDQIHLNKKIELK